MNIFVVRACFFMLAFFCAIQAEWNSKFTREIIERGLQESPILSVISLRDYLSQRNKKYDADSEVLLVELAGGIKGVFKEGEDRFAEVFAYRLSAFLQQNFVPPTVLRAVNGREGSLQFFVESDINILNLEKHERDAIFNALSLKDIIDSKIFCFIIGQWDLHDGNKIIYHDGAQLRLALIDNAALGMIQKIRYGDFAFVRLRHPCGGNDSSLGDDNFPFDQPCYLNCPTFEEIDACFGSFLSSQRLRQIWRNGTQSFVYCIWRNSLWIQFYKPHQKYYTPHYVTMYYQSTLRAYEALNKEILQDMWREAIGEFDTYCMQQLLDDILDRRDTIVLHAQQSEIVFDY